MKADCDICGDHIDRTGGELYVIARTRRRFEESTEAYARFHVDCLDEVVE